MKNYRFYNVTFIVNDPEEKFISDLEDALDHFNYEAEYIRNTKVTNAGHSFFIKKKNEET